MVISKGEYMKNALVSVFASLSIALYAALPQVSIVPWTDSLEIVDYQDNPVTLDHARIIDSLVDGSIQPYESKYNGWQMELIARFDRPIAKNTVRMYGQIYADGYDYVWTVIEGFTGEKTRKCWKPIDIPALAANQELTLVKTMLGSDFYIFYNKTSIFPPFGLSFTDWIQKFYTGIKFLSRENLGVTVTIDVVLFDQNNPTETRTTLASYSFTYDEGKYKDSSHNWFDSRIGWYDVLPRDYRHAINCEITSEDDSLYLKGPGKLEIDDNLTCQIQTRKISRPASSMRKVEIFVTNPFHVQPFEEIVDEMDVTGIASMSFYVEDGQTNLCGLANVDGVSKIVKLSPTQPLVVSGETTKMSFVVERRGRNSFVTYYVNDNPYTYNGQTLIRTSSAPFQDTLKLNGNATITDMYGVIEEFGGTSFVTY